MMENNDIPCVLVPLLEAKPWIRVNAKGQEEKFEDQQWLSIDPQHSQSTHSQNQPNIPINSAANPISGRLGGAAQTVASGFFNPHKLKGVQ